MKTGRKQNFKWASGLLVLVFGFLGFTTSAFCIPHKNEPSSDQALLDIAIKGVQYAGSDKNRYIKNPPEERGLLTGEHTRMTNPNAFSLEMLGRGGLYSVNFDRVLTDEFVAGIGIGSLSGRSTVGSSNVNVKATVIPLYVNYYFQRKAGSVFATAGMSLVRFDGAGFDAKLGNYALEDNGVVPGFGAGYENRGDYGFLFRVTAYAFLTENITPWLGFTFGYAF